MDKLYPRYTKPITLIAGLTAYVAFTWGLVQNGYMHASESTYAQMVVLWVAGFVALSYVPSRFETMLDHSVLALLRSLWCNLGVVAMAVLVPHSVRVLMLVVPLFGVFYAALYLNRSYVLLVAVLTWIFYVLASMGLASYAPVDPEFESLLALAFACMLAGGFVLSWEALQLRDQMVERNDGLRLAMERLQEMALKDELTGVHNRRYVLDVLNRQKALADREQASFTVCFCDLDHFKRVNDRFGHAVGDKALKQFAELATGVVRNIDYVARFGGEEFLLVLVGASESAANNVAERLRMRTKEMWIPDTDEAFSLSVSIGVTRYREGERVDDVLNRADRALYQAKQGGRDKVVVADNTHSLI